MKKLYLAGPDVFRPDAVAHGEWMKLLCRQAGFEGLFPLDNLVPSELGPTAAAGWIKQANRALIEQADGVVANISPFRGPNVDDGTAWEIGFAEALGKAVVCYTDDQRSLYQRVLQSGHGGSPGGDRDASGMAIENFGLPANLQVVAGLDVVISIEAALAVMRSRLVEELVPAL